MDGEKRANSSEFGELPALASPWQTGTTKDLRDTTQTVPRELRTAQSSQMCPGVSQRRWDNEGHGPRAEHPLPARAGADPPPAPTFPLTPTTAHPKAWDQAWDQTSGGIWGAPGQSLAQLLPPHPLPRHSKPINHHLQHPEGLRTAGISPGIQLWALPRPRATGKEGAEPRLDPRESPERGVAVPWSAKTRTMLPGTLNSSTLQASSSLSGQGSAFLFWKILQSTGGTGTGLLGLGLALKPKDFNKRLSCKLSSVASTGLRRAQARLRRSHIAAVLAQTKNSPGWGPGGVDSLIEAFDLISAAISTAGFPGLGRGWDPSGAPRHPLTLSAAPQLLPHLHRVHWRSSTVRGVRGEGAKSSAAP